MNGSRLSFSWLHGVLVAMVLACPIARPALAEEVPQIEDVPLADEPTNEHTPGFFWHPMDIGSESQFNPLTGLMNGGFDILRNPSYQDTLTGPAYGTGARNVLQNVFHPLDAMSHIGWSHFVAHEVFPIRGFATEYGQFVPNWFMHGLGEGMLYRKLEDWYAYHDVSHPRLLALLTVTALQFANEVTENGSFRGPNQDPIADMLIWNPLGLILFSFEPVARFFTGPVKLNYWPGQAVLSNGMRVSNQGENYAFKFTLGLPIDVRFFAYIGKEGLFGASGPINEHDHISVAVGPSLKGMQQVMVGDGTARMMIPGNQLIWESGLFWDRDESLVMSIVAGLTQAQSVVVNVYPGLWEWNGWSLGGYGRWGQGEGSSAGVTLRGSAVGLGWVQQANDHPQAFLH
jgi:hypothetical protein